MATRTEMEIEALSPECRDFLFELLRDSVNWSGTPMVDLVDRKEKGFLTNLKKAGFLTTFRDEGIQWVEWTEKTKEYASENEINLG